MFNKRGRLLVGLRSEPTEYYSLWTVGGRPRLCAANILMFCQVLNSSFRFQYDNVLLHKLDVHLDTLES